MKKYFLIPFGLGAVALFIFISVQNFKTEKALPKNIKLSSGLEVTPTQVETKHPENTFAASPVFQNPTTNVDVAAPVLIPDAPVQTVTHSGSDFNWGEFSNTVAKAYLQLSGETAAEAYAASVSGIYASARHLGHRSFDTISIGYAGTVPAGSTLKLQIQVMDQNNQWSGWQEIGADELNQPIAVNGLAAGWQYQFTFFAGSAEASPRIKSVTITTRNRTQEVVKDEGVSNEPLPTAAPQP